MASEPGGSRLLQDDKQKGMGLLQDKLNRQSVKTSFSKRKVDLIHNNSTANGENKARMISEPIYRNREAFSTKEEHQFPTEGKTWLQLEMKYLGEKKLERKRQNNDKRKMEINEVIRKVEILELQHMPIWKEDKV